jgi:hypothetical protein
MRLAVLLLALFISGCATTVNNEKMVTDWCFKYTMECVEAPEQVELPTYKALRELPPAELMPVVAFARTTASRANACGCCLPVCGSHWATQRG